MRSAPALPEFVTSRRHRVTAGVGLAVIAALTGAAATLTPAAGTPLAATSAATPAGSSFTPDRGLSSPAAERSRVGARPVTTEVPPATSSSPTPNGPAISALAAQGIPIVALEAYRKSAELQAAQAPSCHLSWTLVAAIGAVESGHGTHAGAQLYADGQDLPHVIGPVLDGSAGNAVITDTDQGRYDGDPVHDRAVGPMQFIPSTWARIGQDASGDGVADPFNIIDAAAATGAYLCRYGQDLATDAGRQVAVFGYNHLDSYVATVLALDAAYAGRPVVATSTSPVAPPAPTTSASAAPAPAPSATPAPRASTPVASSPVTPTPAPSSSCPTPSPTDPATPTTSPSPLPTGCPTPSSSVTAPSSSSDPSPGSAPSSATDAEPDPADPTSAAPLIVTATPSAAATPSATG